MQGGHPEQTALIIKNVTKDDIGNYTCELSNLIGSTLSDTEAEVDVYCK